MEGHADFHVLPLVFHCRLVSSGAALFFVEAIIDGFHLRLS